jgi:type I restriction enzyme S subunit
LRERLIDWFGPDLQPLRTLIESASRQIAKPNQAYRALGIRSHGKGTFERFVSDPSSVAMEHLYVALAGDLIVNITFAWEGAVALVPTEHDGGLVSHRFPTFEPREDQVNPRFLRHALRMPRFTYLLGVVSPGGAGRNRVLNKTDFLELDIPAPSLKAQDQVAKVLDDAEAAIAAERLSLEALQRQKRGLMQKLLTGEWRVKVGKDTEATK